MSYVINIFTKQKSCNSNVISDIYCSTNAMKSEFCRNMTHEKGGASHENIFNCVFHVAQKHQYL